jgi:hypothetical protein
MPIYVRVMAVNKTVRDEECDARYLNVNTGI